MKEMLKRLLITPIIGVLLLILVSGVLPMKVEAQGDSGGGELTNARINGATGMQYIGQFSSAAKRTISWTRTGYITAVNVYWARELVNPGYCTAPDPSTQGNWAANVLVTGENTSSSVLSSITIAALTTASDYCLLIRDGGPSSPWAVTDQFTIDNTVPTITSRETQDLNGDGQIDAMKITFSQPVKDSTVSAANFDVAGYAGEAFSSTTNGDVADNNIIYITFTPSGAPDTNATPTLQYTAGTLTDLADNPLASNGPTVSLDKASPVPISAVFQDTNGDGTVDQVVATFSENLGGGFTNDPTHTEWSFPSNAALGLSVNGNGVPGPANVLTLPVSATTGVTGTFPLVPTTIVYTQVGISFLPGVSISGDAQTGPTAAISVDDQAAPQIIKADVQRVDGANVTAAVTWSEPLANGGIVVPADITYNNVYAPFPLPLNATTIASTSFSTLATGTINVDNPFLQADVGADTVVGASTAQDNATPPNVTGGGIAVPLIDDTAPLINETTPTVPDIYTRDSNGNGYIDSIEVDFNENMDPASTPGGTVAGWSVIGHTITPGSLVWSSIGTGTDNAATFAIDEIPADKTDAHPIVAYGSGAGTITDADGNTTGAPGGGNLASTVPVAALDGAGPEILSAHTATAGASGTIVVDFSEPVDKTSLAIADFTIVDGGDLTDPIITAVDNVGSGTSTTLTINGPVPTSLAFVDTVAFSGAGVADDLTVPFIIPFNKNNGTAPVTITDGIAPTVTSATTADNNTNGQIDRMVVVFSENVTDAGAYAVGADTNACLAVTGYDVTSVAGSGTSTLTYTMTESGAPDTAAIPALTFTPANCTGAGATPLSLVGAPANATDGAGPAIIGTKTLTTSTFQLTFSEPVSYASIANGDLKYMDAANSPVFTGINTADISPGSDQSTYTVTVSNLFADGETTAQVEFSAAGVIDDVAVPAISNTQTAAVTLADGIAPIGTVNLSAPVINLAGTTQTVAVTYSELMAATAPTIAFSGGTFASNLDGGWGGNTYTESFTDSAFEAVPAVTVSTSGATDGALNPEGTSVAGANNPFLLDTIAPTLAPISITSNNVDTTTAKAGNIVTLSFTSSEPVQVNPVVTFASGAIPVAGAVTVTNVGGNNWTATYTVAVADTVGLVTFTIDFTDIPGNPGVQVTAVTDASSVTINKIGPTAIITNPTAGATVSSPVILAVDTTNGATSCRYSTSAYAGTYSGAWGPLMTAAGGTSYNTTPSLALANGPYIYYVVCEDAAGKVSTEQSRTFTVGTAPTLTGITPNTVQTDLAVSPVVFTFADETAFDATAGNNVVEFTLDGGVPVPAYTPTVGIFGTDLTLTYTNASLPIGTHHFNATVKDAAGNITTASATIVVEAAAPADTTNPTFVNSTPTTGAVGVSTTAGIATLNYSEPIALTGPNEATITIAQVGGASVKGAAATVLGSALTINYLALADNTSYVITVPASAITDLALNPAAQVQIYFTTQTSAAPDITSLSISGVTDVAAAINYTTSGTVTAKDYRVGTTAYSGAWTAMGASPQALAGLTAGTTYYYQVRFYNNSAVVNSVPLSFTTAVSNTGLSIDSIQMVKTYATAGGGYAAGWAWKFNVTINNPAEVNVAMKFAQWVSGANLLDAAGNMQYSVDGGATWTPITANGTYPANIAVGTDNDPNRGGRQVTFDVQMQVPGGTPGGSYSTSYGVRSA